MGLGLGGANHAQALLHGDWDRHAGQELLRAGGHRQRHTLGQLRLLRHLPPRERPRRTFSLASPASVYDASFGVLAFDLLPDDRPAVRGGLQIELTLYDPTGSASGRGVTCGQEFCLSTYGGAAHSCPTPASPCLYSITYGDGSSTTGFYVTDVLQYNQVSGNGQTGLANTSITFGCVLWKPVCTILLAARWNGRS